VAEAKHITELSFEELAVEGYEPRVIASAAKLPQQLVEEMLALSPQQTTGGGGTVEVLCYQFRASSLS
jgi:hypothetical protein